MQPTGNPYLDAYNSGRSMGGTPQRATAPAPNHGILGGLYDAFIKPTVSTVAGIPGDLYHTLTAAGIAGGSVIRGEHGGDARVSKQRALDEIRKSNFGSAFKPTVEEQNAGGVGTTLEKIAGKTASNVANVEAFNPALTEALRGATTLRTVGRGTGLGAGFGAVQGAAQGMEQGGNLDQVGQGAGAGALAGGVLGAGFGAGGALMSRLARGKGAAGDLVGGQVARNAEKAGGLQARNDRATQQAPFKLPGARAGIGKASAFDKQGNPVSLQPVIETLSGLNMTPEANGRPLEENMQALHDILVPHVFQQMANATEKVKLNATGAMDAGTKSIRGAGLGPFSKSGTNGAANETRQRIEQSLSGLSSSSTTTEVLQAISKLNGEQARLSSAIAAHEPTATRQNLVYQDVIDHLDGLMNSENVNHSIAQHQLGSVEQEQLRKEVIDAGGSDELANHIINNVASMKNYAQGRSLTQPGVVAGQLARVARLAQAEAPTEEVNAAGKSSRSLPVELAIGLKNPGYMPFALAHAAQGGVGSAKAAVAKRLAPASFKAGQDAALAPGDAVAGQLNTAAPEQTAPDGTAQIGFTGETPTTEIPVARTEMQTVETPTRTQSKLRMPGGQPSLVVNHPMGADIPGAAPATRTEQVPVRRTSAPVPSGQTSVLHGMTTPGRSPVGPPPEIPGTVQGAMAAAAHPSVMRLLGGARNTALEATGAGAAGMQMTPPAPQDQAQPVADTGASVGADQAQQSQSDYPLQNMEADIARDPKNASTYIALYKMINPATSISTIKPSAQQYDYATSGMNSLQQLQQMISQDPGVVGRTAVPGQNAPLLGGFVRNAAGTGQYQSEAQNLIDDLARARTGAAITKQEMAQYQAFLPQAGDNEQTIQRKFAVLQQAFQPYLQVNNVGGQ